MMRDVVSITVIAVSFLEYTALLNYFQLLGCDVLNQNVAVLF